jgi:hypothetical protein
MTNITYDRAPSVPDAAVAAAPAPKRKSWLARMFDAMVEARMQQAHREIARYVHIIPGGLEPACLENGCDYRPVKPRG